MISLQHIARELGVVGEVRDVAITGITQDSRAVTPGDLFVARRGEKHDGTRFVAAAIERGAAAVLGDAALGELSVPTLHVEDVPTAFARAASSVYGHPSHQLSVVGVTGTNGKTTTSHLIAQALDGAAKGTYTGTIGTVGHRFGTHTFPTKHTTPEPDELAKVLRAMCDLGARYVAMEVSSIALSAKRVEATQFAVAAFTNLTQDHLDYHGTMLAYGEAKKRLFLELAPKAMCINIGDAFGRELAEQVKAIRVSPENDPEADIAVVSAHFDPVRFGVAAELRVFGKNHAFASSMLGRHNLENTVVALGVTHALGLPLEPALAAIERSEGVPGRLQRCDTAADDIRVLVDYAHTPDALIRVLEAVRTVTSDTQRIVCVFGCGGDRDAGKRGPMGTAVATYADIAVVTDDNPRTEKPDAITAPIVAAVKAGGFHEGALGTTARRVFRLEHDREQAIALAIACANPGDVVVIAGKGHETYQIVGDTVRDFDDCAVARAHLQKRRG